MKMALAYGISVASTAAMAGLHAAGVYWIAVDAPLILGIAGGMLSAPFVMSDGTGRPASGPRRNRA